MLLSLRVIQLTIIVIILISIPLASAFLPILGDIARDTIGTIGQIGKKIHTRLNEHRREKALNPVAKLGVVKDALIEDYVENHDKRVNRVCEYLRRGKLYRGPCLQDGNQQEESAQEGEYSRPDQVVKEEEITIIEKPRGGGRRGGRRRGQGPHRRPDQVEEITIIENPRGVGRGRGHRGRRPHQRPDQIEEITIIEKPSRKPVVIDEGTHRVQPETVVEEEEDSRPRPPIHSGRGRGKNGQQQSQQQRPGQTVCRTNDGLEGMCMPPSYCFSQYSDIDDYRQNFCQLDGSNRRPGVCCPQDGQTTADKYGEL